MASSGDLLEDVIQPKAPKQERAPRKPAGRITKQQANSIKDGIAGVLQMGSMGAGFLFPRAWTFEDWLTEEECKKEADLLWNVLERHPQLVHLFLDVDRYGPYIALVVGTCALAAPRLARHGILPTMVAQTIASAANFTTDTAAAAQEMGARRSHGADRPDEEREIDASDTPPGVQEILDSVSLKDGPGSKADTLSGASGDSEDIGPTTPLSEILSGRVETEV